MAKEATLTGLIIGIVVGTFIGPFLSSEGDPTMSLAGRVAQTTLLEDPIGLQNAIAIFLTALISCAVIGGSIGAVIDLYRKNFYSQHI
jgi:hypothetical protein